MLTIVFNIYDKSIFHMAFSHTIDWGIYRAWNFKILHNHYKLLKKSMEYYFRLVLNFCTYSFIIFTWVLHVLKDCLFPYILQKNPWKSIRWEQNITACQNRKLQKLIFLDAELHWLHRCEKGVKCAVRLDQWWFLQLLILTPPLFNYVYLNNPSVNL